MRLSRLLGVLAAVVLGPLAAGCAGVSYRGEATVTPTRYATIENFSDEAIAPEQVDGLLEEVAEILGVILDPRKPKVRILVVSPSRIADLYASVAATALHGARAAALYFPGASVVLIPHYDRTLLGHELAHYLTDHYLRAVPRRHWEKIAHQVEDRLPARAPVARRPSATSTLAALASDERIAPAAE
jgi:hypothetical protein